MKDRILEQGGTTEAVYLLRCGLVKRTLILPDGIETIIDLRLPGQMLDWGFAQQLNGPVLASAEAAVDSELLQMPLGAFVAHLQRQEVYGVTLDNVVRDLLSQYSRLAEMKVLDPRIRLQRLSDELAIVMRVPDSSGHISVCNPLTDEELAQMLGLSVRHLRRLRSKLRRRAICG